MAEQQERQCLPEEMVGSKGGGRQWPDFKAPVVHRGKDGMYGGSHCRWLKRGSARLRLYSKGLSGQRVQSGTWPEVLESPGETRVCKEEQLRPPPRQEKPEECRQEQSGDTVRF